MNMIEIPLLAFILSFIIRHTSDSGSGEYIYRENDNIPAYIFMSIIVFSFMGISVSAEEIFKDSKILKRERFLNLSWSSYLLSKIVLLFGLSAIHSFFYVLIGNTIVGIEGMFFSYWIILFSVSCCANIIGLNISSAFDSVVTIYILIPLLLIPQMILGGAMFNYEKLNKFIGGGYQVPIIAEIIPARWAYEALMVDQFKSNRFEKGFYELDKKESVCNFKRGPYLSYLTKIVDELSKEIDVNPNYNKEKENVLKTNLLLDEIKKESKINPTLIFHELSTITNSNINKKRLDKIKIFIDALQNYYKTKINIVIAKRELMLFNMQNSDDKLLVFRKNKNTYYNDYLANIVKNTFSEKKIALNNNQLIQVADPIFKDPEIKSYFNFRSHFFSPLKPFIGKYWNTFSFNLAILWFFIAFLYAALYYNILKKIIHIKLITNLKLSA
jgi:hypothetical protein